MMIEMSDRIKKIINNIDKELAQLEEENNIEKVSGESTENDHDLYIMNLSDVFESEVLEEVEEIMKSFFEK